MATAHAATLRDCHNAFSRKDIDRASKLVSAQVKLIDHGRGITVTGAEQFVDWMKAFHATSSDMELVDASYISAGEYVIAQFRAVGTQDGNLGQFPPTGRRFSLDVCEIWRFDESGRAVEGHNYSDGVGLLTQLGHLPSPAAVATA